PLTKNSSNSSVRRAANRSHGLDATSMENLKIPQALMSQAPGAVVEHLSEGLLIVDTTSELIYWNPAALRLYGFASVEEAVRNLPDLPKLFELATLEGKVLRHEEWPLMRIMRGETLCDVELQIRCLKPEWTKTFRYCGSRVSCTGRKTIAFLT